MMPSDFGASPGRSRAGFFVALVLAIAALHPALARAAETGGSRAWELLRQGGHVVLIRHATTVPGLGDPPNFRLGDCATQRNLSDAGRRESERLGVAFRQHGVPLGRVLSSRWCRCIDTARLAFGRVEGHPALDSFFQDRGREAASIAGMRELVAGMDRATNLVMVTHQVNITAYTGAFPAMGEVLVVRPNPDGTGAVVGRVASAEMR